MIRHAQVKDVPALGKIINDCAEYGLMLHRSLSDLYEHVRDFHVAISDQGQTAGQVVGVCGLSIVWANMAEVYALAVDPSQHGQGLGRQLVQKCVEEGQALGVKTLMTLTYKKAFFEHCGFSVVDRATLPLKVWSECARCPKYKSCDEIAMTRVLDVPDITIPQPELPDSAYEVPIVLKARSSSVSS